MTAVVPDTHRFVTRRRLSRAGTHGQLNRDCVVCEDAYLCACSLCCCHCCSAGVSASVAAIRRHLRLQLLLCRLVRPWCAPTARSHHADYLACITAIRTTCCMT